MRRNFVNRGSSANPASLVMGVVVTKDFRVILVSLLCEVLASLF
jgi:hypothetical protein